MNIVNTCDHKLHSNISKFTIKVVCTKSLFIVFAFRLININGLSYFVSQWEFQSLLGIWLVSIKHCDGICCVPKSNAIHIETKWNRNAMFNQRVSPSANILIFSRQLDGQCNEQLGNYFAVFFGAPPSVPECVYRVLCILCRLPVGTHSNCLPHQIH